MKSEPGRDWSAEFNALPPEVRLIGAAMEARLRIQHLQLEKKRLEKRHRESVSEINRHIKNCEDWLQRLEVSVPRETSTRGGE